MRVLKSIKILLLLVIFPIALLAKEPTTTISPLSSALTQAAIANELGWITDNGLLCGGYYLEPAIASPENALNPDHIEIVGSPFIFSFRGTSEINKGFRIRRYGQEITANKAFLYRDPKTTKIARVAMSGDVILREPNILIRAEEGQFDFATKAPSLNNILYRTPIHSNLLAQRYQFIHSTPPTLQPHPVHQLSAWGQAGSFNQKKPKVYVFEQASYSTCPPLSPTWKIKASYIELNKETGRGEAHHARLLVHGVPIFYTPYFNFPIDARRKTGFLWPKFGVDARTGGSGSGGAYFGIPYYWNIAPAHDMLITPNFIRQRGLQITDLFRYLTPNTSGNITLGVLPGDRVFSTFKQKERAIYADTTSTQEQANLRRLLNASSTRQSLLWHNNTQFNEHWFSTVEYNYVSDDYYLRDLNNNLDEVTQNQLLQQADLSYRGPFWHFIGRLQGYQSLYPIDSPPIQNQYSRLPQLVLNGNYPDGLGKNEYFINNELTHFDIQNTPGIDTKMPMGNRLHIQPGVSHLFSAPYFYFNPRLQLDTTKYDLGDINNNQSRLPARILPIFDANSGLNFDRSIQWLGHPFLQTLEPRLYYTYIPYRNQNNLPIFDTTLNTLTYDQLFTYNRFSGLDRIGDANQVALGLTTRLIDEHSGLEKMRAGVGQIYYFRKRLVTLCAGTQCALTTSPENPDSRRSPFSGFLLYQINPVWGVQANSIVNPSMGRLDNQTIAVQYHPGINQVINLGYNFARVSGKKSDNLSQTDLSFAWPVYHQWSFAGRWTENIQQHNFQNLLFGVQYDSCCWALRLMTGREFIGSNANRTLQYNTGFVIQIALKGLGNLGYQYHESPLLLNSISGYQDKFGEDF